VTRLLRRLAPLPVAATAALAFVLLTFPGRSGIAIRVYELFVAAFALAVLVAAVRRAQPVARDSLFERGLRRPVRANTSIPELERLRREVALATATAFDVHVRLRPTVRRVARQRLLARRGIDLDAQPEQAREILGAAAWELARADRPAPRDRNAPGLRPQELREVVEALERVA